MANGHHYAIYALIGLAAALAIVFVLAAGNTEQAYAPPPPPCDACATQIEGSGFGTITIPEDSEIGPGPLCPLCFASLSFNATVLPDTKKHEVTGSLAITYLDEENVEHSITGDITKGEIKTDSFKLEGIVSPQCAACEFVLKGTIEKGSTDTASVSLKASDGTTGTFNSVKVTITSIPRDLTLEI
jgi:hypothetical protein